MLSCLKFVGFIMDIHEDYLNQIEYDCQHGNFHHIELLRIGRHAPINLVVFQVFTEDEIIYFAAEVESWYFDSDANDFLFFYIVDDLKPVEFVEVKEMKWRFK